jgi:hypothetical protein
VARSISHYHFILREYLHFVSLRFYIPIYLVLPTQPQPHLKTICMIQSNLWLEDEPIRIVEQKCHIHKSSSEDLRINYSTNNRRAHFFLGVGNAYLTSATTSIVFAQLSDFEKPCINKLHKNVSSFWYLLHNKNRTRSLFPAFPPLTLGTASFYAAELIAASAASGSTLLLAGFGLAEVVLGNPFLLVSSCARSGGGDWGADGFSSSLLRTGFLCLRNKCGVCKIC